MAIPLNLYVVFTVFQIFIWEILGLFLDLVVINVFWLQFSQANAGIMRLIMLLQHNFNSALVLSFIVIFPCSWMLLK